MGRQRRDDATKMPAARARPYAEYARTDPFAPLWWRWRRAIRLAEGVRSPRRWTDDAPTRAAVALVCARAGRPGSAPPSPELIAAADVFEANGEARWAVEAALLARLSDEQSGSKVGLASATVGMYEAVFFDVRARLDAADWITWHVFGGPGGPFADPGSLWRWAGYTLGEAGFDAVRAATTGAGRDRLPPSLVETIELMVAVGRLPALPGRRLWQLHLRVLADRAGRPAAAYHQPRRRRKSTTAGRPVAPPALPPAAVLGRLL